MTPYEIVPGRAGGLPLLFVADHASNAVPRGLDLGIAPSWLDDHIAVDIGAAPLARALASATGGAAFLATLSRLVVDTNRPPTSPGLVPEVSDGVPIPGNRGLDADQRAQRLAWHDEYHGALDRLIETLAPEMLVSVHSFTPALASDPGQARPWQVAILYNQDDRAARRGLDWLAARGHAPGDNQPYSGRVLNYTMDRHAEARGLPYLGFEVRQDQIASPDGVAHWAAVLAELVAEVGAALVTDHR